MSRALAGIIGAALLSGGAAIGAVQAAEPDAPGPYRVIDLGALAPAGASSIAFTINDAGDVAGAILSKGNSQAVVWRKATTKPKLVKLGPSGQNSVAFSVNQPNDIVGEKNPSGVQHAVLFPTTPLDPSTSVFSIAFNSNSSGVSVGMAGVGSDPNAHAVLFNGGQPVKTSTTAGPPFDLGNFGTDNSIAYDINGSLSIVGTAATASGPSHAFLHQGISKLNKATDDLGTLGGLQSAAACINNFQQVAGWSDLVCHGPGKALRHAFLWQSGKMKDLGTPYSKLPAKIKDPFGNVQTVGRVSTLERLEATSDRQGGECMNGRTIKEKPSPQIVGYAQLYYGAVGGKPTCTTSQKSFNRAFLYDGAMHDLNTMISSKSGWYLLEAFGINNGGQIVGQGRIKGQLHAFLLLRP